MIERRKHPRVRLTANSVLRFQDEDYKGQLENISVSGALVKLERSVVLSLGGEYLLTIYIEGGNTLLQLFVEVVCAMPSYTGVKFVSCDTETTNRLEQLVEKLAHEQESTKTRLDTIRFHMENYLR